MVTPSSTVAAVLEHAGTRPPTLGGGRLVCVDGLAGSGKTTLAEALVAGVPGSTLVHSDDLLHGWEGLPGLAATIERFLEPLSRGESSSWTRWDWIADGWAEQHEVSPGGLLVVEGVGSGASAYADLITTLVWVEASAAVRLARGIARDGEAMRERWVWWMEQEAALHAADRTRQRADLVVDGLGRLASR